MTYGKVYALIVLLENNGDNWRDKKA